MSRNQLNLCFAKSLKGVLLLALSVFAINFVFLRGAQASLSKPVLSCPAPMGTLFQEFQIFEDTGRYYFRVLDGLGTMSRLKALSAKAWLAEDMRFRIKDFLGNEAPVRIQKINEQGQPVWFISVGHSTTYCD